MKKYFAEWIPVEGKVEMGDKFIDTEVMNLIGTRTNKEGVYDFQKVKLFLCTRDIQWIPGQDEHILITNDKDCWGITEDDILKPINISHAYDNDSIVPLNDGQQAEKDTILKVIGEISPDATWVKRGDQFDEDDWHKEVGFFETVRIKIKGPCGHFH